MCCRKSLADNVPVPLFFAQPVDITVTVKNIETFDSVKMFISTVKAQDIKVFKKHKVDGIEHEPEKL
jgi:hypothetical protein